MKRFGHEKGGAASDRLTRHRPGRGTGLRRCRYPVTVAELGGKKRDAIELGLLAPYERPPPTLDQDDHLLRSEVGGGHRIAAAQLGTLIN